MFDSRTVHPPQSPFDVGRHKRTASMLRLTDGERAALIELGVGITADPTFDPVAFTQEASQAARALPSRLRFALERFAACGSDTGILVLDNVATSSIPATPPDNTRHVGEQTLMAREQAVLNHVVGHMIAYEAEGFGRLFQDMVPNRAHATRQTSLGFGVELELHTEQAFSDLKPGWVSLACLRGNTNAKTYAFSVSGLLPLLSEAEITMLREPLWVTGVDESFRIGGHVFINGDVRGPLPILSGPEDDMTIVLDQDLMRGITKPAQRIFEKVMELYVVHRRAHVLQPGQVLLLDNRRAVHGRSPFQPSWDGNDRFIVRSFVVRDVKLFLSAVKTGTLTVQARYS